MHLAAPLAGIDTDDSLPLSHRRAGHIWAHRADGLLVRRDAGSGRRTAELQLPEPGAVGIADVGRELWIATPTGQIIIVRR